MGRAKKRAKKVTSLFSKEEIEGVAISAPGAVNGEAGIIEGISAIPYIHHFPIQKELEAFFQVPVTFENDANCAGIAEVWKGAAKEYKDVLFVVIGTGVGGAVIKDGKVQNGAHLYGGEFGLMLMDASHTFSQVGTAVKMAERYCARKKIVAGTFSGKNGFELAEKGDKIAIEEVNKFYDYVSRALFSLQFTMDPESIVIGGGVSANKALIPEVNKRVQKMFDEVGIKDFYPVIKSCMYQNEANLIGAVATFYQKH